MKYSIFILIFFLFACASKKKYHYFNDDTKITSEINNFNPKIKSGDLISVNIYSYNKENVIPFNLPQNTTSSLPGYTNGIAAISGYLVNQNGNVELPILGSINVLNKTTVEIIEIVRAKLTTYIQDPIVSVHILNFKVTVLGEVKNPGSFLIPNERITILEALGLAGDMTINGLRKEVLLIRDENGKKVEINIDLTSKEIFNNEYYYLSQNDVIYVKPNQAKVNSSTTSQSYGTFISVISVLITTLNFITK